jgi:hypothetical protein
MKSWAQGEVCVCELFMNATLPRLVVGRAGGGLSVALGLLEAGRGRVGRHGGEKSAEESSADMACSPWGGGVVWLGAEAGGARVARPGGRSGGCFRSAHALVMECLRRFGEGSTERVPQCARSHIEQVNLIPAQAVKAFLDSGARAACRANGCRSIGLNSEAEALMVWRQQRS